MNPDQLAALDFVRRKISIAKAACAIHRETMKSDPELLHHIDIIADELQDLMTGIDVRIQQNKTTDGVPTTR